VADKPNEQGVAAKREIPCTSGRGKGQPFFYNNKGKKKKLELGEFLSCSGNIWGRINKQYFFS
jgi:hypothetical protein